MVKRIVKKSFLFFVLIVISMNSFAALVSDNDGSAFITKTEFDSLNIEFQDRLNTYTTGIDTKIENAIASYFSSYDSKAERSVRSLLDENGYYGGFLEKWSSNASGRFDGIQNKIARCTYHYFHNMENRLAMVSIVEPIYYGYWNNNDLDYYTSKKVKIKLNDGTIINNAMRRMKITTTFVVNMWELKMDRDSNWNYSGWDGPTALGDTVARSYNEILQNKYNITIINDSGYWNSISVPTNDGRTYDNIESWQSYINLSTSTGEVSTSYDKVNINYPLSNSYDYYWDPDDTSHMEMWSGSSDSSSTSRYRACQSYTSNWNTCATFFNTKQSLGNLTNSEGLSDWGYIYPYIPYRMMYPWGGCYNSHVTAGDEYLEHWNTASNKNRKVRNGMYLGTIPIDGDLTVEAEAEIDGSFYVFLGDEDVVVDTWVEGDDLKRFDLEAGTAKKCKIENVKKNKEIRIMFHPTAGEGVLKIHSINVKEK